LTCEEGESIGKPTDDPIEFNPVSAYKENIPSFYLLFCIAESVIQRYKESFIPSLLFSEAFL
jgi:hypothetical protein